MSIDVHPIFANRRFIVPYLTLSLPLVLASVGLLAREPRPIPFGSSIVLAVPLSVVGVALLLPVYYLCRALPVSETPWPRLLATHGGGALLMGAVWA